MTTFILHGGQAKIDCDNNNRFWAEFTNHFDKKTIKICLIYWAREPEKIPSTSEFDQSKIREQAKDKEITFIIPQNAQEIANQINNIDVIYFSGGDYEFLNAHLQDLEILKKLIPGKIYIGSSMGAFVVCKYSINSFEDQDQSVHQGMGLVPVSNLGHWNVETRQAEKLQILLETDPTIPVLPINETEFVKFVI